MVAHEFRISFCLMNNFDRRRGAHCDAALPLPIFVDHGGKLFERIEVKKPAAGVTSIETTYPGEPLHPASFCPRHVNRKGQGDFRITGLGSFVTFLAHQEK